MKPATIKNCNKVTYKSKDKLLARMKELNKKGFGAVPIICNICGGTHIKKTRS